MACSSLTPICDAAKPGVVAVFKFAPYVGGTAILASWIIVAGLLRAMGKLTGAQVGEVFRRTFHQMWGACLVGVLIFGLLSDILQLQNIDSNVQLVMKGLIIVCTVLVQEQNLGQLLARWRHRKSGDAQADPRTVETHRPPSAAKAQLAREDLDEAS